MKWFWANIQLLLIISIVEVTFAGVISENEVKQTEETTLPLSVEITTVETVKVVEAETLPIEVDESLDKNGTLRTYSSNKKRKPSIDDDDDHHHHQPVHVIAVQEEYHSRPKCADANEIWSFSNDCDVQCDNQGILDHHHGSYNDYSYGYFRSSKSHSRCRRMVSDVLLEEGYKNITTREDLGYPPETKAEYLARTKRNFDHGSSHHHNDYLIVHSEPHYRPPPGECVCRRGFARLHKRCVPYGQCPQLNCRLSTEAYVACAPCPKTCANMKTYDITTMGCVCAPRCVCKHGLVLSPHGRCVTEAACAPFTQPETTTTTTTTTTSTEASVKR